MQLEMGVDISQGQQEARTRWGTHESGAEFDRKKRPFLTTEAADFISQQVMCIVVGLGPEQEPSGLMITGQPGFIAMPDEHTCLIPIDQRYQASSIVRELRLARARGARPRLALCFLQHNTRQRICVQGEVEIVPEATSASLWLRLHVSLAFFHCPKYIRTRVSGLHYESEKSTLPLTGLMRDRLTKEAQEFLHRQVLCYLCTVDEHGQCAVNHRGGKAGFLVTMEPDSLAPGGVMLLPDYAGNGAFEAIGNILETGQAALFVPSYTDQMALCLSGGAAILEPAQLPISMRKKCRGAQRVVAITVRHVEQQRGDWSAAFAYERLRAEEMGQDALSCQV